MATVAASPRVFVGLLGRPHQRRAVGVRPVRYQRLNASVLIVSVLASAVEDFRKIHLQPMDESQKYKSPSVGYCSPSGVLFCSLGRSPFQRLRFQCLHGHYRDSSQSAFRSRGIIDAASRSRVGCWRPARRAGFQQDVRQRAAVRCAAHWRMRFSDEHETSSVVTFYGVPPLARTHWRSLCFELTNVEDYENLDEIIATCKRAVPENSELWGSKADVTERGQAVHQFLQRLRREDRETFARQVLPGMLNRERKRFIMGTKITVADVVAMFAIRPVIARWNRSPDVRYDSTDMLNLWDWFDFMQHAVKEFGDQSRYQVIHPPASHALLEQDLISPKDESLINLLWSTMANGGKASKKRTSASKKANAPRKETDWMLEDEAIASADTSFDTAIGSEANRKAKDAQTTSDLPDGFDLAEDEDVEMNLDFLMDEEEGEFEVRRGKSGSSSRAKRGSKANGTIASSNMTLFMNDMDHDTDLLGELNADTQNDQHGSEAASTFLESQGWGAASETATQGDPEHTRLSTAVEQGPGTTPPSTPASAPSKGKSPSKTTKEERSPLARVDIRVGCILTAKPHPDADALYVEEIDIGREDGPVTVCSGLRNHIPDAAALLGPCVVVANLKPVKMRGIVSQAMVLCATAADGSRVELIKPPSGAKPGDRIYFPGTDADRDNQPDPQLNPKKKIFEKVAEHLHTSDDASCEARYDEIPFMTDHGACRAATIQGGTIR